MNKIKRYFRLGAYIVISIFGIILIGFLCKYKEIFISNNSQNFNNESKFVEMALYVLLSVDEVRNLIINNIGQDVRFKVLFGSMLTKTDEIKISPQHVKGVNSLIKNRVKNITKTKPDKKLMIYIVSLILLIKQNYFSSIKYEPEPEEPFNTIEELFLLRYGLARKADIFSVSLYICDWGDKEYANIVDSKMDILIDKIFDAYKERYKKIEGDEFFYKSFPQFIINNTKRTLHSLFSKLFKENFTTYLVNVQRFNYRLIRFVCINYENNAMEYYIIDDSSVFIVINSKRNMISKEEFENLIAKDTEHTVIALFEKIKSDDWYIIMIFYFLTVIYFNFYAIISHKFYGNLFNKYFNFY